MNLNHDAKSLSTGLQITNWLGYFSQTLWDN